MVGIQLEYSVYPNNSNESNWIKINQMTVSDYFLNYNILSQKGIYQLINFWEEAFQFFKVYVCFADLMKMEMISIACCIVVGQQRCNISNVSFCGQLDQVITEILITKLLTCQASSGDSSGSVRWRRFSSSPSPLLGQPSTFLWRPMTRNINLILTP